MEYKLNHIVDNENFYLYYDHTLIFKNGKSMPLLVFETGKGDIVALYKYTFTCRPGLYEFEFHNGEARVKLWVVEKANDEVYFIFRNVSEGKTAYNMMSITLWKENEEKVFGLPTFKSEELKGFKKILFDIFSFAAEKWDCAEKYVRKLKPLEPEQKLSFFVEGKYFFENIGLVKKYHLYIKDKIFLKGAFNEFQFRLRFCETIDDIYSSLNKNNYLVRKYPHNSWFLRMKTADTELIDKFIKEYPDKPLKGVIIENKDFDLARIMIEKKKIQDKKLDAVFVVNRKVCGKHKKKYFIRSQTVVNPQTRDNEADFHVKGGIMDYLVTVRKLLDSGVDGIYFDDDFRRVEMTALHKGMKKVIEEYPQTTYFHTHLSEDNDDFGYYVVKEEKVIENMDKLRNYFFYSGECYIGKEEKDFTENNNFDINIIKID